MIDTFNTKTYTVNQMQCLLLFMLLFIFMEYFNLFHFSFLQNNAKQEEISVIIQEKPAPASVEIDKKEVLAHQIKKSEPLYDPIILKAASIHDVDLTIVKAIIMAESGYNRTSVSRRGARGLMQLTPGTAKSLGVKDIFNPEENIHAGVRYYKSLLNRFDGDEKLALAAYNAGPRNVHKYQGVPPFNETHQYINKVLSYQQFYKHGPASKETTSL